MNNMARTNLDKIFYIVFVLFLLLNCVRSSDVLNKLSTSTLAATAAANLKSNIELTETDDKSFEIFKPTIVHSTELQPQSNNNNNTKNESKSEDAGTTISTPVTADTGNNLHRVALTSGSGSGSTTNEPSLPHFMVPISESEPNETNSEPIDRSESIEAIPSRSFIIFRRDIENCPRICNHAFAEHENDSKLSACNRGCRYFILSEIMIHETDAELKLNQSISSCFKYCFQSYDNGTENCDSCLTGCKKTAELTTTAESPLLNESSNSELERETISTNSEDDGDVLRSISIFIPIRTTSSDEESKVNDGQQQLGGSMLPPPSVMQLMLSMMHSMHERAQQMMASQQGAGAGIRPASDNSAEQSNVQESSVSLDDSGNTVSVQRSMSMVVTNDQNGQRKVVVMHSQPKVTIHRKYNAADFLSNRPRPVLMAPIRIETINSLKDLQQENSNDNENYFTIQSGNERIQFAGDLHRPFESDSNHINRQGGKVYYRPVRPWSACLYTMLPRLFYLTMIILMIYVIFWLFCSIPSSRQSEIILTNPDASKKSQRKGFFGSFNSHNKYFKLNNKAGSNASLASSNLTPPPYPGVDYFPQNVVTMPKECLEDSSMDTKLIDVQQQEQHQEKK